MRKNNVCRERGKSVKIVYEINGLNLNRFIDYVKKKGIVLYDAKKVSVKKLLVTVNLCDSEKFFAIAKELCYNIKKVRYKGVGYPFFYLIKNFGLIIGLAIFISTSIFFNDLVLETTFVGNGTVYGREVTDYLQSVGVVKYSRFSSVDLKALSEGIMKSNNHLSFASCKKKGNRLEIQLVLSEDTVQTLDGNVYEMKTDVDGVVESIKVYRGTALFSVGDNVKAGDVLVGGYAIIKEQTVKVNLLATVTVITEKEFYYRSNEQGMEKVAEALAEQELCDKEILTATTSVTKDQQGYIYKTVLKYRRVYFSG